jgi:hypothetical protein
LLDLWAEEELSQVRTLTFGYVLAQTAEQVVERVASGLAAAGISYALTGTAAANKLAPFITYLQEVEIWVPEKVATPDLMKAVGGNSVGTGHNITFLTTSADTGLAFARPVNEVTLANPLRIYGDLRRDPKRGKEQAQHLREEVLKL